MRLDFRAGTELAKKIKLGDMFEVQTSKGLGYFQVIYSSQNMGECVRAFEETYPGRINDLDALAAKPHMFITFTPVKYMARIKLAVYAGNAQTPAFAQKLPLFRSGLPDANGHVKTWWLSNEETGESKKYGPLTPEIIPLPIGGIWTPRLLILGIEQGYRVENDPKGWGPHVPPEYR
jgi:hypothetical protein